MSDQASGALTQVAAADALAKQACPEGELKHAIALTKPVLSSGCDELKRVIATTKGEGGREEDDDEDIR